jgi:malic enzyme
VSRDRVAEGAMYPRLGELRGISRRIAVAVACAARDDGVGRQVTDTQLEAEVDQAMWWPGY